MDIRYTVAAFHRTHERLRRLAEDRTRMPAAVGHDLGTPSTRQQLVSDGLLQ